MRSMIDTNLQGNMHSIYLGGGVAVISIFGLNRYTYSLQ